MWPLVTDSTHQLLNHGNDQTPSLIEGVDCSEAHEEVDPGARAGILITNLTKRFKVCVHYRENVHIPWYNANKFTLVPLKLMVF